MWFILFMLLSPPALGSPEVPSPVLVQPQQAPEAWLHAVDAQAAKLPSLRYSATRVTVRPSGEGHETRTEERWRFMTVGSRFRIDYFGDTSRQITSDGALLLDYVPANRQAVRHHLQRYPAADQQRLVSGILGRVAVPGFRVGFPEGLTWTYASPERIGDRDALVLEGRGEGGHLLKFWIDAERTSVLASELWEGGTRSLRMTSSAPVEISPGIWFPTEIEMQAAERGGLARVSLRLTRVGLVGETTDETFLPSLDSAIPVVEKP